MYVKIRASLIFIMLSISSASQADRYCYKAYDLTNHSNLVAFGIDINERGQIVGVSENHAFLKTNGVMVNLGTLGGTDSLAEAINNHGVIAGEASTATAPYYVRRPFVFKDGIMADLGTPGNYGGLARSINDHGQIVGTYYDWDPLPFRSHAFLYEKGLVRDVGIPNENAMANSINSRGQIVGVSGGQAFIIDHGVMTKLGAFTATAINNAGKIAGNIDGNPGSHVILYDNNVLTDFGTLGGFNAGANAINVHGQIVGWSEIRQFSEDSHAFVVLNGVMTDLNDITDRNPDVIFDYASGINDRGQILARGSDSIVGSRGYLLNPTCQPHQKHENH